MQIDDSKYVTNALYTNQRYVYKLNVDTFSYDMQGALWLMTGRLFTGIR